VFFEKFADTLRKIQKYSRNHGLIVIIGASDRSKKYSELYPAIDKVVLGPIRDRNFICRWRKVIEHNFTYRFDDKYGKRINDYFIRIKDFLLKTGLWNSVPDYAKDELEKNTTTYSSMDWNGITWKMIVYKKHSRPKSTRLYNRSVYRKNPCRFFVDTKR